MESHSTTQVPIVPSKLCSLNYMPNLSGYFESLPLKEVDTAYEGTNSQRSNVDQPPIVEDISHYGEEVHIGVNEDDQVLEEG